MKFKITIRKDSARHPDYPYNGTMKVFRNVSPGVGYWDEVYQSPLWFETEHDAIAGMKRVAAMEKDRLEREETDRKWKHEEVIEV